MKNKILDTAWLIFRERGVHALSMRNIASELDLSATALYRHYSDKESLLSEMIINSIQKLFKMMSQTLSSTSAEERLLEVCLVWLEFSDTYPREYRLMFHSEYSDLNKNKSTEILKALRGLNIFMKDRIMEYLFSKDNRDQNVEFITFELLSLIKGMISEDYNRTFIHSEEDEFKNVFRKVITKYISTL